MTEPMLVRKCLHRFCKSCLNSQELVGHQENKISHRNCPMCKSKIGNKRLLIKDEVLHQIISKFLPSTKAVNKFNNLE